MIHLTDTNKKLIATQYEQNPTLLQLPLATRGQKIAFSKAYNGTARSQSRIYM